jgi:hypothetical protein
VGWVLGAGVEPKTLNFFVGKAAGTTFLPHTSIPSRMATKMKKSKLRGRINVIDSLYVS